MHSSNMNDKEQRIKELASEERRICDKIQVLQRELDCVRQEMAQLDCPYEVGDRIIYEGDEAKTFVVVAIKPEPFRSYKTKYRLEVAQIKKNGEPYAVTREVWNPARTRLK